VFLSICIHLPFIHSLVINISYSTEKLQKSEIAISNFILTHSMIIFQDVGNDSKPA